MNFVHLSSLAKRARSIQVCLTVYKFKFVKSLYHTLLQNTIPTATLFAPVLSPTHAIKNPHITQIWHFFAPSKSSPKLSLQRPTSDQQETCGSSTLFYKCPYLPTSDITTYFHFKWYFGLLQDSESVLATIV